VSNVLREIRGRKRNKKLSVISVEMMFEDERAEGSSIKNKK